MTLTFKDLEALAQEEIDFSASRILATQMQQYQSASSDEILELLEGAQEVHRHLRSTLPTSLRQSLEVEIEFFTTLARFHDDMRPRRREYSQRHSVV